MLSKRRDCNLSINLFKVKKTDRFMKYKSNDANRYLSMRWHNKQRKNKMKQRKGWKICFNKT